MYLDEKMLDEKLKAARTHFGQAMADANNNNAIREMAHGLALLTEVITNYLKFDRRRN